MNLTDENYHMFNKEAFMKCKKHPIIVNEGRGPLICDEDLVWALDNGYIRGAAHAAQRLLLRHVQLPRGKALDGQRPVLRQRRVRQGQGHPQRRQRLIPASVSAGLHSELTYQLPRHEFSALLSFCFCDLKPISSLTVSPEELHIPVSASGRLRRGHGSARTQRRMPAGVRRFLRLTVPHEHSRIK